MEVLQAASPARVPSRRPSGQPGSRRPEELRCPVEHRPHILVRQGRLEAVVIRQSGVVGIEQPTVEFRVQLAALRKAATESRVDPGVLPEGLPGPLREPQQEIAVEIDPGKTLEIRLQAVGETDEQGEVKVFFELNGQPRVIRVPNRLVKAATAARPKAAEGNPHHIGAPMPGSVASVGVTAGAKVNAGDLLLTIEAMKMETGIHADRAATVKAVHVHPGSQIEAKDLLVELE